MPAERCSSAIQAALPYTVVKPTSEAKFIKKRTKKPGYEYNHALMLSLVLKQSKPDWSAIASAMCDKSESKTYDLWRKALQPSLTSSKPWSGENGSSWTTAEKIKVVMLVLESTKIDWHIIATTFPGRTKAQVYDVWRKAILPKLKKGDVIG